ASLCAECGAAAEVLKPVPDDPDLLERTVGGALGGGADLVIVIAGSSAGSADFTPSALERLGEILVHGVAMMPGKPTLLGAAAGRPVAGIPGYPVSALVAFREFVAPLLYMMQGVPPPEERRVAAVAGRKIPSKLGLEEHVRVIAGEVGGRVVAVPVAGGAGVISSVARADGFVRIPQEAGGLSEGEETTVELLASPGEVGRRLLFIGSHDLTIDLLAGMMLEKTSGRVRISSANVGSLGGLTAINRRIAHVAGCHLLDEETGGYNVTYVRRHVPDVPAALLTLVRRVQGFMTAPGNPKGIRAVGDLAKPGVRFVNRQSGSGTRVLLDYELKRAGIDPACVAGCGAEEYTHVNVAVAVASGAADAGLGIHAAAKALSLDFVPLTMERFDLVIPSDLLEDERIKIMIEIIRSRGFRERVLAMGGYDVSGTGSFVPL
ncbi:MAG: substrate-binding domain-containing protein, partial [bacterium]